MAHNENNGGTDQNIDMADAKYRTNADGIRQKRYMHESKISSTAQFQTCHLPKNAVWYPTVHIWTSMGQSKTPSHISQRFISHFAHFGAD